MLRRIRDLFSDVARQADLVLLALCGVTSLFGILMFIGLLPMCFT